MCSVRVYNNKYMAYFDIAIIIFIKTEGNVMGTKTDFRLEEAERLVKWILKNPGKWNSVIDDNDMNTDEHFADLLQILQEEEFYQMIVFLLSRSGDLGSREIEQVRNELIAEIWNKDTIVEVTGKVISKIREKIANRNNDDLED